MSLLNMFCAICQKAGDIRWLSRGVSSHWLVTLVSLLSLFPRVVPFRRPELGVYCVGVHLLIAFPVSILHPCKILESNRITCYPTHKQGSTTDHLELLTLLFRGCVTYQKGPLPPAYRFHRGI